jgi:hypothetical protein
MDDRTGSLSLTTNFSQNTRAKGIHSEGRSTIGKHVLFNDGHAQLNAKLQGLNTLPHDMRVITIPHAGVPDLQPLT